MYDKVRVTIDESVKRYRQMDQLLSETIRQRLAQEIECNADCIGYQPPYEEDGKWYFDFSISFRIAEFRCKWRIRPAERGAYVWMVPSNTFELPEELDRFAAALMEQFEERIPQLIDPQRPPILELMPAEE